jgi:hypothetical protein
LQAAWAVDARLMRKEGAFTRHNTEEAFKAASRACSTGSSHAPGSVSRVWNLATD